VDAAASEIVDAVFKLSHIDAELAGLLVAITHQKRPTVQDYRQRFVELQEDNGTTRPQDLDCRSRWKLSQNAAK
jgi:hypothetical protein